MKTLVTLGLVIGYALLHQAQSQRNLRLAMYGVQLDLWKIREDAAVRRALTGGEPYEFTPPPRWHE